jgi:hypothetical protein
MAMYFVKNTDKGIVVANNKLTTKEVTLNGKKRMMSTQVADLKFGFFACENPEEIGYTKGDTVPVVLSDSQIEGNLFWCNPA